MALQFKYPMKPCMSRLFGIFLSCATTCSAYANAPLFYSGQDITSSQRLSIQAIAPPDVLIQNAVTLFNAPGHLRAAVVHLIEPRNTPLSEGELLNRYFSELRRFSRESDAVAGDEISVFGNEGLTPAAIAAAKGVRGTAARPVILGTSGGLNLEYALHADADVYISDINPEVTEIAWPLLLLIYHHPSRLEALETLFSLALTARERRRFQTVGPYSLLVWAQRKNHFSVEKRRETIDRYTTLLMPHVSPTIQSRVPLVVAAFFNSFQPFKASLLPPASSHVPLFIDDHVFLAMEKWGGTLNSEEDFQATYRRIESGGVHVATRNLSGKGMASLMQEIKGRNETVIMFYPSNVIEHLRTANTYIGFFDRLLDFPIVPTTVVVRGYSGTGQVVESFQQLLSIGRLFIVSTARSIPYQIAIHRALLIILGHIERTSSRDLLTLEVWKIHNFAKHAVQWIQPSSRELSASATIFDLFMNPLNFIRDMFHSREELRSYLESQSGNPVDDFDLEILAIVLEKLGIFKIPPSDVSDPRQRRISA